MPTIENRFLAPVHTFFRIFSFSVFLLGFSVVFRSERGLRCTPQRECQAHCSTWNNPGRGVEQQRAGTRWGGWERMDTIAHPGHDWGVPTLDHKVPSGSHKSLARRTHRALVVMETQRVTMPARLMLDARDECRRLHQRIVAEIPAGDPAAVASLVKAAVALRGQLLDLLSLPTRPRGESRRRMLTLPPSDVSTVEPLPPDPRTIPGVPPLDA